MASKRRKPELRDRYVPHQRHRVRDHNSLAGKVTAILIGIGVVAFFISKLFQAPAPSVDGRPHVGLGGILHFENNTDGHNVIK